MHILYKCTVNVLRRKAHGRNITASSSDDTYVNTTACRAYDCSFQPRRGQEVGGGNVQVGSCGIDACNKTFLDLMLISVKI